MANGSWELKERNKVLCAILHTDNTTIAWAFGLRNLIIPGPVVGIAGMPYDHARNAACMRALEMGVDYCLSPRVLVETGEGPKRICDIKEGDLVRTHLGRLRPVTKTFRREVKQGSPLFEVHTANSSIRCTPEHPFFVERLGQQSFIRARDLITGDSLLYPDRQSNDTLQFGIRYNTVGVNGDGKRGSVKNGGYLNWAPVTNDLARFLGLFVAEGCAGPGGVCFTFNNAETGLIDFIQYMTGVLFDRRISLTKRWATNVKINIGSLGLLFREWFGAGARNKKIPNFVFKWNTLNRLHFLMGYLQGDGHESKISGCLGFRTASKQLANDLIRLGASCGVHITTTRVKASVVIMADGKEIRGGVSYQGYIAKKSGGKILDLLSAPRSGEYLKIPITGVVAKQQASGLKDSAVYNLEVEEDESYIADCTSVHNCFFLDSDVIPPADAVLRLLAHNQPIVSGVYFRRSPPHGIPVMLKRYKTGVVEWVKQLPPSGLMEVDLVGAGCMLIRRDVLEQMKPIEPGHHWFCWRVDRQGHLPPGECLSEDFAMNLHAQRHGFKIYVDCSIRCRHIGLAQAGPEVGQFQPCETIA